MGYNEFEGRRVRLRAIEPEDWEHFHRLDADTDLARTCGATHLPTSRASSRQWAEEASKRPEGDKTVLAIETLEGTVLGSLSAECTDRRSKVFHYGIGIGREHWRQGYGTEAVMMLLRFYFDELGYQKAEAGVYGFNEGSVRFHEALGFQHEGRRRRVCFTRGQYHDLVLMGMTAEEFSERHRPS